MPVKGSIFRQKRYYGGYSDDEFLGITNSFYRATGLEIRKNPSYLTLQKALSEQSSGTITQKIQSSVVLSTGGRVLGGIDGSDGKIWYQASGGVTWSLVYTHTGAGSITGMGEYNGYFYWVNDNKLNRTALSDIAAFSSPTLNYKTLSANTQSFKPMIEVFNVLYIGQDNVLDSLDSAGTLTNADLTLPSDEVIRNITFTGSLMNIYTRKDSESVDFGACYFWDTIGTYNKSVPLDGKFQCATTMNNVDYFICGLEPALYKMEGLTPVRIKKIPLRDSSFSDTEPVYIEMSHNAMTNNKGIVYFGTGAKVTINGEGEHYVEKGIWSYGKLQEGYPEVLTLEWASADYSNKMFEVNALMAAEGKVIVVSRTSSPTYHVFGVDFGTYNSTGEMETRIFDANSGSDEKNILRIAAVFYPLASGEKIEIYARENLTSAYGNAILTIDYSDTSDRNITYKKLTDVFDEQINTHIQFKVKLTSGTSGLTTPKLLDLSMNFEQVNDV